MIAGIYKIVNMLNGKTYIGESLNIEERWDKHKLDLRGKNHHSKDLQEDYNKYGIEIFKFEIIEEIDSNFKIPLQKQLLVVYEDKYIKQYDCINNGYNTINTLESILKGEQSLFGNKPTEKDIYILRGLMRSIDKNNGIYLPSKNAFKKEKTKSKTIQEFDMTSFLNNKSNIKLIIDQCKNYKFNEEFVRLSEVLRDNGFEVVKTYQLLRDVGFLDSNKDNGNKCIVSDISMFKCEENFLTNKETSEVEKVYYVTYISRQGFKTLLKKIFEYARNNNINIFTKKYIKELIDNKD